MPLVYDRIDDALEVLRLTARFDACVLQSSFDDIPLGLLAFLKEHGVAVVADGTGVTGVDVDAVASDWRGALDAAVDALITRGHRRIALLAWPGEVQPLQSVRHHFGSLRGVLHCSDQEMPLVELHHLPRHGESPMAMWQRALAMLWTRSDARLTAVVAWGLERWQCARRGHCGRADTRPAAAQRWCSWDTWTWRSSTANVST